MNQFGLLKLFHNGLINFLAFFTPVVAHGRGLPAVRGCDSQVDQIAFVFFDNTVDGIFPCCIFKIFCSNSDFIAQLQLMVFQIIINVLTDGSGNLILKIFQGAGTRRGDAVLRMIPDSFTLNQV